MRKLILLFAAFAAVTSTAAIRTIELDGNSNIKEMLGNDTLTIDSLKVMGYLSHKNLEPVAWMTYYRLEYLDLSSCSIEKNTIPKFGLSPKPYIYEKPYPFCIYATKLKHVIFPQTVTTFEMDALCGSVKLETMELPKSTRDIGRFSFSGLQSFEGDIVIPEGVSVIGKWGFCNCPLAKSLTLPSTLKVVMQSAFEYLQSVKSLALPEGLMVLEDGAFAGMADLDGDLELPSSLEELGPTAFWRSCIDRLIFKPGCKVTKIQKSCFEQSGIKSVSFSDNISEICTKAFLECRMPDLYFPESLQTVGAEAFAMNANLSSVVLPSKLRQMDDKVFSSCPNLNEVYVKALTPPTITATTFENAVGKTLYVPLGAKSAYEAAPHWKEFGQIVEVSQFPSVGGVEAVLSDGGARVYGTGGTVVIDGDSVGYAVFTADGRLLLEGSADGRTEIPLAAGLYIVKTATGSATKVAVR